MLLVTGIAKKKENCLFDFTYCKKYNLNSYFFNKKKTKNMLKNCAIGFRLESHSLAAHFACQRLRHQWHVRKIQMSPLFSMYPVPTRISLRKKTKLLLLLRANCQKLERFTLKLQSGSGGGNLNISRFHTTTAAAAAGRSC